MIRTPLLAQTGVALLLALGAASPAAASTVVGSPLDVTPTSNLGASNPASVGLNTVAPAGSTLPINTPAAGVLTEIRVRHGATTAAPSILGLRIASGALPNFSFRKLPSIVDKTWPANQPAGFLVVRPLDQYGRANGVPIAVGESIALLRLGVTGTEPSTLLIGTGTIAYGGSRPSEGTVNGLGTVGATILVQWIVEPDADVDGYGDDSQDTCVGTAGPCLPVATGPEVIKEVIKEVPVFQTVTEVKEVLVAAPPSGPSPECVSARKASTRAGNVLKKAQAALKKRKSAANRRKVSRAKETLAVRKSAVQLVC